MYICTVHLYVCSEWALNTLLLQHGSAASLTPPPCSHQRIGLWGGGGRGVNTQPPVPVPHIAFGGKSCKNRVRRVGGSPKSHGPQARAPTPTTYSPSSCMINLRAGCCIPVCVWPGHRHDHNAMGGPLLGTAAGRPTKPWVVAINESQNHRGSSRGSGRWAPPFPAPLLLFVCPSSARPRPLRTTCGHCPATQRGRGRQAVQGEAADQPRTGAGGLEGTGGSSHAAAAATAATVQRPWCAHAARTNEPHGHKFPGSLKRAKRTGVGHRLGASSTRINRGLISE